MVGISRVNHASGTGTDVVTVVGTGEIMTKAAFCARYPRALLIVRTEYGRLRRPEVAGDSLGEG